MIPPVNADPARLAPAWEGVYERQAEKGTPLPVLLLPLCGRLFGSRPLTAPGPQLPGARGSVSPATLLHVPPCSSGCQRGLVLTGLCWRPPDFPLTLTGLGGLRCPSGLGEASEDHSWTKEGPSSGLPCTSGAHLDPVLFFKGFPLLLPCIQLDGYLALI